MNHLTNLYKHKCEQLQEQIYRLTRQLNEFVGGPEPHLPDVPQPFQVPKEYPNPQSGEEDFVNQERDPMNYPPTLKQWLSNYPNPGKTHPNYQYWLMMYQAAQRYYTRAQQAYPGNRSVRESVQYLKRQLNEADAPGPTQFPSEPPLLPDDDFQVPLQPNINPNKNPFGPTPPPNEPKPGGYKTSNEYRDAWFRWFREWQRWNSGNPNPLPEPRAPSGWEHRYKENNY